MSWLKLKTDHLLEALSGPEATALRTASLGAGQADPLPDILLRTTLEVRGYIAANAGRQVGEEGTIPQELLSSAIAVARWRLLGRLPVRALATDSRRQEYEDAIAQLRDVAAGKFAISNPEDLSDDQPRPPAAGAWGGAKEF